MWINRNGNSFSEEIVIKGTPQTTNMDSIRLVDLTGSGVSGVLWTGAAGTQGKTTFFLDFHQAITIPATCNGYNMAA